MGMKTDDVIRMIEEMKAGLAKHQPLVSAPNMHGHRPIDAGVFYAPRFPKTLAALGRLPVNKHKFSRAKWYVAEYDWVHYGEVMAWCKEQFGPHPARPDAWSRWWDRYEGKIFLRDPEDYMMFKLRWGE
jgi:hypothetical protein